MRIVLALVALWCGATSALAADRMCSAGYGKPAEMVFGADGKSFAIKIDGHILERWTFVGPRGYGLNGSVFRNSAWKTEPFLEETVFGLKSDGDETGVYIFEDRIFWPCK